MLSLYTTTYPIVLASTENCRVTLTWKLNYTAMTPRWWIDLFQESFSPDLFPISSRFAAGADVKQFHLLSFKPNPGCSNCKQAQDAIRLLKKRLFANKQDQIKKSSAPNHADDRNTRQVIYKCFVRAQFTPLHGCSFKSHLSSNLS